MRPFDQIETLCRKLAETPYTRRAQAITWKVWEDNDCYDPACLQSVWCRITEENGSPVLSMNVRFRSNDAYKAAFMNIFALVEMQRRIAARVSELSGRKVEVGRYCHMADSYHLYGSYFREFEARFLGALAKRTFEQRTLRYADLRELWKRPARRFWRKRERWGSKEFACRLQYQTFYVRVLVWSGAFLGEHSSAGLAAGCAFCRGLLCRRFAAVAACAVRLRPLNYRRNILHGNGARLPLSCSAKFNSFWQEARFVCATSMNVVLVLQQIRQVGLNRLLQIEKLVGRLAVLPAEAGIFILRNAVRHAVHAGQHGADGHVGLESQIQTIGAGFKLAAPVFLRRHRTCAKTSRLWSKDCRRRRRHLPFFRMHLGEQVVQTKLRQPDFVHQGFHLCRFHIPGGAGLGRRDGGGLPGRPIVSV